jgi:hypothetical protein
LASGCIPPLHQVIHCIDSLWVRDRAGNLSSTLLSTRAPHGSTIIDARVLRACRCHHDLTQCRFPFAQPGNRRATLVSVKPDSTTENRQRTRSRMAQSRRPRWSPASPRWRSCRGWSPVGARKPLLPVHSLRAERLPQARDGMHRRRLLAGLPADAWTLLRSARTAAKTNRL